MLVEIDLVMLAREDLNINEFLTLKKAYNNLNGTDLPFFSEEKSINSLITKNYFKKEESGLSLTAKAIRLVADEVVKFEELFDMYPHKTPNGRILRTLKKEYRGKPTVDFARLKNRYLKKVKNQELHEDVLNATKAMISDYTRRGSLNFLPLMETFVNQNQWERYIGLDNAPVTTGGENVERI